MGEVANNDLATDITPVVEQTQQAWNATVPPPPPSQPFMTLPFDEEIFFWFADDLKRWIIAEKALFEKFLDINKLVKNVSGKRDGVENLPEELKRIIELYLSHYDKIHSCIDVVLQLLKMSELNAIEDKKENIKAAWMEFIRDGLIPMKSRYAECAMSMSKLSTGAQQKSSSTDSSDPRLGLIWLNALIVSRKHQSMQLVSLSEIKARIAKDTELLVSLEEEIKNGQDKIKLYEEKIEAFRLKGLKAAALIAPADALTSLEAVHAKAAKFYFGVAGATVLVWILFTIFCYYPYYVKPLLEKIKEMPLEAGAMVLLTSMAFTGIMLTLAVILLRLAVSRVNFSVAAGERKTIATAYRALLSENAISNDQQLIFLQSIVGRNFPGYVDSNGIPTLQDTLGSAAKNLRGGDTSDG